MAAAAVTTTYNELWEAHVNTEIETCNQFMWNVSRFAIVEKYLRQRCSTRGACLLQAKFAWNHHVDSKFNGDSFVPNKIHETTR